MYAPDVPWVTRIMKDVAIRNKLDFEKDFKLYVNGNCTFFCDEFLVEWKSMVDWIDHNRNVTQNAFIFPAAYENAWKGGELPPDPGFVLLYNHSRVEPFVEELQRSVEESIFSQKANVTMDEAKFDIQTVKFPYKQRISQYDVVAANGAVWFFLPPMITFFIVLTEIVAEKESRLRIGMKMMGLSTPAYWLVWALYGITFSAFSTAMLIVSGWIFQFTFFTNANVAAIAFLFMSFGIGVTTMAMFLAALISKSGTAQTVGYAFVLVGFIFQTILASASGVLVDLLWTVDTFDWVVGIRWGLTFYPPFNMAKVFADIASKSSSTISVVSGTVVPGVGFTWADLFEKNTIKLGSFATMIIPSPMESMGWILVSSVIFIVLMLYFDAVLGGDGSKLPFYFMFSPSYWKPAVVVQSHTDVVAMEDVLNPDLYQEYKNAFFSKSPLRIQNVVKTFPKWPFMESKKDVKAVRGVSLTAEKGELLCLLGHNGAGKTTLINMLTGLFLPTEGTALIEEHSVRHDIDTIRRTMGVCPQHDILWGELTAREHLELFAILKGIPSDSIDNEVDRILPLISLDHVADNRVSSFSGGMKRRLSVGISTIGNPSILFMDEPTTGLDPVNKRVLWHLIQQCKKDTVIVLTTHEMEEADVLSDKVAIMAKGELKCVGRGVELKNRFGSGYRIQVVSDRPRELEKTLTLKWSFMKLEETSAGSLQFSIPPANAKDVSEICQFMEDNSGVDELVTEWGLSHATLEEVFLRVTKESEFGYDALDDDGLEHGEGEGDFVLDAEEAPSENSFFEPKSSEMEPLASGSLPVPPEGYSYRALFRKNFTLQSRQRFTNICQITTPVLVVLLLLILQVIIKAQLGDNFNASIEVNQTIPWPLNEPFAIDHLLHPFGPGGHSVDVSHGECEKFFLFSAPPNLQKQIGNLTEFHGNGILGEIPQVYCSNGHTDALMPYFEPRTSMSSIESEIYQQILSYNKLSTKGMYFKTLDNMIPDGFAHFSAMNETSFSATLSVNTNPTLRYHRKNNFTRVGFHVPKALAGADQLKKLQLILLEGKAQMLDYVARAFTNFKLKELGFPPLTPMNSFNSLRMVQQMPYTEIPVLMDVFEVFGVLLYPMSMALQLPVYVFLLVLEKRLKLREMMKSHGLSDAKYHFVNYVFCFFLYSLSLIFFWISGVAVDLRFFVQTHWSVLLLFFVFWGTALVSLAFLISTFLSDPRAATVVGYGLVMMGALVGTVIAVGIYGPLFTEGDERMPAFLSVFAFFPYVRGIYLMNYACATSLMCYGPITELPVSDEIVSCIISLALCTVCYLVLFLYLDAVLPREYGIPKHPLFFIDAISSWFKSDNSGVADIETTPLLQSTGGEDSDVARMRQAIQSGKFSLSDNPLVTAALHKKYGDKVAVESLYLKVPKSSCFGLLGENGAGKTTTISMLTGLFPPTSGAAFVGGYSIVNDIDNVHKIMGLCPQFDILWEDLTCKEHLLFYGRLKGVDPEVEDEHARKLLKEVGLYESRNRYSSKLSGGMKRRLSLAISLCGNSRIIFLDEPTTGLDPASRRHIWTLISRARAGRSIVLTTHNMLEAETLCNQIGILAYGTMRCIGSPLHLRTTHGEGYRMTLAFDYGNDDDVLDFVSEQFPDGKVISHYRSTMEITLPPRTVKVASVFKKMEARGKKHVITDWSICQLGLGDVFQAIVKRSNADRRLQLNSDDEEYVLLDE
eukprot:TRINITY_DN7197_c0_g1_i1.p1 TRINITY_DN7197_c0_g1~~TRINITY_DN7197_c0_g1_i1.p1  ORF type:complete len:1837 (-),score=357.54 TRINITY_DN7197_c0_g1_i1:66-5192(-)